MSWLSGLYRLDKQQGRRRGHKIKVLEIDNEYKCRRPSRRMSVSRRTGRSSKACTAPADRRAQQEAGRGQDLGTSPGFGTAAAADGKRYPYTFPIAASYWSQAAAAVAFAKERLGGSLKGKKIAYVFYDNPAGKEPLAVLEDLARTRASRCAPSRCRHRASDGRPGPDITGRFKPDFVIAHLFGRSPSVLIKELKGKGYPLSKVVGLVWASSEADIIAAGGMGMAEGYNTIQFAGVGKDFPVIKDIEAMYKAQGKQPPKEMDSRCSAIAGAHRGTASSRRCATPSRPRGRHAELGRGQEGHGVDHISRWAALSRRWRSRLPITRAAAGSRSGRSRAASSSGPRNGSRAIARSS